jgi:branched-chain amino acid transport system substrate-binding protein
LTVFTAAAVALAFAISGAGASAPAAGGGTTRGVTDDSIKVGGLVQASFFSPHADVGAEARFKVENDKGGVFGRQIDFIGSSDDGGDNAQNSAEGRSLVQEDEVFAVVPVITPALSSGDFFLQNKVPFFGWGIAAGFCDNPAGFGFSGCLTPPDPKVVAGAWGEMIKEVVGGTARGKTAAVISEDNDSGEVGHKVIASSARAAGFKVVYSKNPVPPPPAPAPDPTPFANEILSSNDGEAPDVVFVVTSFSNVTLLQNKLTELGYDGVLTNAVGYDPRIASQFTGSSVYIQFNAFESAEEGNANMQEIIDNVRAVDPDIQLTQPLLSGYLSADIFVKALKATGKNLTAERLLQTANKMRYSYKDITSPIKYPQAHGRGGQCGTLVESDGTNYSIRVPFGCYKPVPFRG